MSERSLITGAQLIILETNIKSVEGLTKEHIKSIRKHQYVGNSSLSINDDVAEILNIFDCRCD